MKIYNLNSVTINHENFNYFFTREKNDVNGNPRYKVFIMDPDAAAVHEIILKCYESQIPERVAAFIEGVIGVTVPF